MPSLGGTIAIKENVHIVLRGADGAIKDERKIKNTVTTAGKNAFADQLLATPTLAKPTHVATGTGTPGATALGVELNRQALTTKTRSGAVVTIVADWAAGVGTGAITEAGIFDAATTGNMHASQSFAVINKAAGDTLQITWTLTFA
jgi:hypothetical protein